MNKIIKNKNIGIVVIVLLGITVLTGIWINHNQTATSIVSPISNIRTYGINGHVSDNYDIALENVLIQNSTDSSGYYTTSASGFYSISNLPNGTYNFSYSKYGFNTGYLVVTIKGADNDSANIKIYDTTPSEQATGLASDTPTKTTVNLSWNSIIGANYYQVFRNGMIIGYTKNNYWHDTNLDTGTLYQYNVRANDSYNNWGLDSTTLNINTVSNNLLSNPGFETTGANPNIPTNWSTNYKGILQPIFSYPEPGRNGGSSVTISCAAIDDNESDWVQVVGGINSANTYKISGWIKTQNITAINSGIDSQDNRGGATVHVDWYDSGWNYLDTSRIIVPKLQGTMDWTFFEKNITNIPSNAANAHIVLKFLSARGKVWYDDIYFAVNDITVNEMNK